VATQTVMTAWMISKSTAFTYRVKGKMERKGHVY
jgi:hypothetical protein